MKIDHRDFKKNPLTEAEIKKMCDESRKGAQKELRDLLAIVNAPKQPPSKDDIVFGMNIKDPDTADEGKEWCIFVWDSVNDMGLALHSRKSACHNLCAILEDMDNGDTVDFKVVRDDKTPAEIAALPVE